MILPPGTKLNDGRYNIEKFLGQGGFGSGLLLCGDALFDADGRRYVDMYNNVPCVGHANPRVNAAWKDQVDKIAHLVPVDYPLPELPVEPIDDVCRQIAVTIPCPGEAFWGRR